MKRIGTLLPLALVLTATTSVLNPVQAGGEVPTAHRPKASRPAPDRAVTLITGDRVVLTEGKLDRARLVPGKGRRDVAFTRSRVGDRLFVIPSDVAGMVAAGQLDRRLFDIAGLLRDGYDDSATESIPLIVTYDGTAGRSTLTRSGARRVRELPAINGSAVRVDKADTSGFLAALPVSGKLFDGGVERVWLDAQRRTVLDESVPQIGAPEAWQAGYTGRGVTVAVLDSGIDASHPDLAGRVDHFRNFAGEADTDEFGHGTHVASIIAGGGQASGGRYRGVAPDARLIDAKVCRRNGRCADSAIIAAMQWSAAELHADVVNISLGGPDYPGVDPLEEAVNRLSAETGTLFVIAAGNSGREEIPVDSPGSADAALTVGAVDKQDAIADFSSRGPRVGDGAAKPDITAPGVDITAAKAKDTELGDPVGEHYARLSGTSMATPHTAGAAVLLSQQHPGWTGEQVKAALMASARPAPAVPVTAQGAGRVDLTRAIHQSVTAHPASVSLGVAAWPHDDDEPVTKQITYRNLGTTDMTLTLSASLNKPDGEPAPDSALSLDKNSVTVPAGGTGTVTVRSNTRHEGPDGAYSGRVTATDPAGGSVTTPVVVVKEVESYDLTLRMIGLDGRTAAGGVATVIGWDQRTILDLSDADGTIIVRLPKARYFTGATISGENGGMHFLMRPVLTLDRDTTLTLDARTTKPVTVTVPHTDARPMVMDVGTSISLADADNSIHAGVTAFAGDGRLHTAHVGPPIAAPDSMNSFVSSHWAVPDTEGGFANSPYTYGLLDTLAGGYYTGFTRNAKHEELAKVTTRYGSQLSGRRGFRNMFGDVPESFVLWNNVVEYDEPTTVTHYFEAGRTRWSSLVGEFIPGEEGRRLGVTILGEPLRTYQAGRAYAERWNAAVFGPLLTTVDGGRRSGDEMVVSVPMYSDQDGHPGLSVLDTASTKLYRNGELIAESAADGFVFAENVPGATGDFRLVTKSTRPSWSTLSTATELAWTFRSETTSDDQALPLWGVRYFPAVDGRNTVKRQQLSTLPVRVEPQPGATVGKLRAVRVQVSGDDGLTWTNATVRRGDDGRYVAVFATPIRASHISLKTNATDDAGNTTVQTIIRAYGVR